MRILTKVVSTKLSNQEYNFTKALAQDLFQSGELRNPTTSELLRSLVRKLMETTRGQLLTGRSPQPICKMNGAGKAATLAEIAPSTLETDLQRTASQSAMWNTQTSDTPLPPNVRLRKDVDGEILIEMLDQYGNVKDRFKRVPLF